MFFMQLLGKYYFKMVVSRFVWCGVMGPPAYRRQVVLSISVEVLAPNSELISFLLHFFWGCVNLVPEEVQMRYFILQHP